MRWTEQVELLQEEMQRYRAFMVWKAAWWKDQASRRDCTDNALAEGLRAYAYRQYALRSAYEERAAYLWRFCPLYLANGFVSKDRNWFEDEINPKGAPPNAFLVYDQSRGGAKRKVDEFEASEDQGEEDDSTAREVVFVDDVPLVGMMT